MMRLGAVSRKETGMIPENDRQLEPADYGRTGPQPDLATAVLADWGLSDGRIGNYYNVSLDQII